MLQLDTGKHPYGVLQGTDTSALAVPGLSSAAAARGDKAWGRVAGRPACVGESVKLPPCIRATAAFGPPAGAAHSSRASMLPGLAMSALLPATAWELSSAACHTYNPVTWHREKQLIYTKNPLYCSQDCRMAHMPAALLGSEVSTQGHMAVQRNTTRAHRPHL